MLNQLLNQYAGQHNKQITILGKNQRPLKTTEMQMLGRLSKMKLHLNQMNSIRRQQYETKMSSMVGSMTGAGFTNFNPSDFN